MIILKKEIFKQSEKKTYYPKEKVNFSKKEEKDLVDNGFAEFVKERKTKESKVDFKTK